MRVAFIFSGIPRRLLHTWPKFHNFSQGLERHDTFLHAWLSKKDRGFNSHQFQRSKERRYFLQESLMKRIFQPTQYLFQDPESFDFPTFNVSDESCELLYPTISKGYPLGLEKWKLHLISSNFSMWDSIYRAFSIYEDFHNSTNEKFDLLVRCRYDVLPRINMLDLIENHDFESISVPKKNIPSGMYCDWFAMGKPELMKHYFTLFNHLPEVMEEVVNFDQMWCNEYGLFRHLSRNKIKVNEIEMKMEFN
jgi:hypothetical protein